MIGIKIWGAEFRKRETSEANCLYTFPIWKWVKIARRAAQRSLQLFAHPKIRWIVCLSKTHLEELAMEENHPSRADGSGSGSPIVPARVIALGNVNVYSAPFNPCCRLLSILVSIYERSQASINPFSYEARWRTMLTSRIYYDFDVYYTRLCPGNGEVHNGLFLRD